MNTRTQLFLTSRGVVLACLVLAAGYFVVMKHWQHLIEFVPYLILLACPLMHVFGGHGRHGKQHGAHTGHHLDEKEESVGFSGRQKDVDN